MARPKSLTEVVVPLSTRIKLDTAKRLDDFCVKNRDNKEMTKGNLVDRAITDLLDKLEKE